MTTKIVVGVVAAAALLFGAFYLGKQGLFGAASGPSHFQKESFLQGLAAGARDQFSISNTGALTSSAAATFTGAVTLSGAVSTGLFTQGGGVTATTSSGAGTLTAAELFGGSVLEHTNAGATTITLPASTTITAYVATAGQCVEVLYKNKGTATDTLAGGTGTLLKVASSTKTVLTGGIADLKICRTSNTDVEVFMSPAI